MSPRGFWTLAGLLALGLGSAAGAAAQDRAGRADACPAGKNTASVRQGWSAPFPTGRPFKAHLEGHTSFAPIIIRVGTLPAGWQFDNATTDITGRMDAPGTYDVKASAGDACSTSVDFVFHLVFVSADTQPPALGAFTLTSATLPASGGTVSASLGATDDRAVTSVLLVLKHPDGHEGGGRMAQSGGTAANGTWSLSWTVPANATDQPVTYQVRVSAADSARNTATSPAQTITVAAHQAAGPLLPQKPKVP